MNESDELLLAVNEIRDLIRVMAEPAMAERDRKARAELKTIVGSSAPKATAALLMDGTRTQRQIHSESGMHEGNLSTFVKQLKKSNLLSNNTNPTLAIKIPSNFFET
jgi:hypothetical protein